MLARRRMMQGCSNLLALPLLGCFEKPKSPDAAHVADLIDAHCHVFNASDLPVVGFLRTVVLEHYPRQEISVADEDGRGDFLEALISLLTWILGRTRAPSAAKERALLLQQGGPLNSARDRALAEQGTIAALAEHLDTFQQGVAEGGNAGAALLRREILRAAGVTSMAVSDEKPDHRATAEAAYRSDISIGQFLRWASLFAQYRTTHVDALLASHQHQGFRPLLLTPALIDYDCWLGEYVEASPLPEQVELMPLLTRRFSQVPVHGYVAFDPLRQAYFAAGVKQHVGRSEPVKSFGFDPLALVRTALTDKGFIGVKMYPPMGFKPYANSAGPQEYQHWIVDDQGAGKVGAGLDDALAKLYDTCVELHAPILAHATASNDAGPQYRKRADPAYWIPVFRKWPSLHVCLGHFGSFAVRSAAAPAGSAFPEASWEWAFGAYVKENPNAPVFGDVSYFSEFFKDATRRAAYAGYVMSFIKKFDPDCRHLVFGTDWIMLGLEKMADKYSDGLWEFFKTDCNLSDEQMKRLFVGNALQFLGLEAGNKTRARLVSGFYDRYGLDASRLP